jgi:hypothetical protein
MTDVLNQNSAALVEITTGAGDVPCWAHNPTDCSAKEFFKVLPADAGDSSTTCTSIPSDVLNNARNRLGLFKGDCQWQEFVYALAEHENPSFDPIHGIYKGTLKFRSFSSGNEVDASWVNPPCNSLDSQHQMACIKLIKMQADACVILRYVDSTFTGCGTPSFTKSTSTYAGYYLSLAPSLINPPPLTTSNKAGDFADILIGHMYADSNAETAGQPEQSGPGCPTDKMCDWPHKVTAFTNLLNNSNYHMVGKKFRIDEGGWGQNFQTNSGGQLCSDPNNACGCMGSPKSACMDADSLGNETILGEINAPAPGYVVRSYLEALANGAESFFWYTPGSDEWGSFADCPKVNMVPCPSDITPANFTASAYAYLSLYDWAVGSTFNSAGIQNPPGTTKYTYSITAKDNTKTMGCSSAAPSSNYVATIAWDQNQGGSTLACDTFHTWQYCAAFSTVACGIGQPFCRDTAHPCSGSVPLGPNPILLEHN